MDVTWREWQVSGELEARWAGKVERGRANQALTRRAVFDHIFRLGENHLAGPIGLPALDTEVSIARVANQPGLIGTCVNIRRAAGPAFVIGLESQLATHVEVKIA
jgi:hypothetical protein